MSTLTRARVIPAPSSKVWAVLRDFAGVHRWHPKVETSPLLSDNNEGLGATRVCHFYDGTSVKERVVEYREGESMKIELSEFSMPLHRASATLTVRATSTKMTEVTMQMDYDVKFGPLGWIMSSLMIQPMMGKMFEKVLGSLEHHLVTGELIGRDGEHIRPAAAF
ncbi:MAG: SRPBCC family protein [Kofleriaceae bacterium]